MITTREDQSRNGVKVIVTRFEAGGTTVDADCQCFGIQGRVHSSMLCPLRLKAMETRK